MSDSVGEDKGEVIFDEDEENVITITHSKIVITKMNFAELFLHAFDQIALTVIKNGFFRCELFSFDTSNVDYTKFIEKELGVDRKSNNGVVSTLRYDSGPSREAKIHKDEWNYAEAATTSRYHQSNHVDNYEENSNFEAANNNYLCKMCADKKFNEIDGEYGAEYHLDGSMEDSQLLSFHRLQSVQVNVTLSALILLFSNFANQKFWKKKTCNIASKLEPKRKKKVANQLEKLMKRKEKTHRRSKFSLNSKRKFRQSLNLLKNIFISVLFFFAIRKSRLNSIYVQVFVTKKLFLNNLHHFLHHCPTLDPGCRKCPAIDQKHGHLYRFLVLDIIIAKIFQPFHCIHDKMAHLLESDSTNL